MKKKNKKKKKPTAKVKIKEVKRPRTDLSNYPESSINENPVWKLGKIDFAGEWGFNNIDNGSTLKNLHQKLKNFESMTWGEIEKKRGKSGKLNHFMTIDKISANAQERFEKIRLSEEYDTLYSFHLSGTERLWGIRENEIYYILWWDKHHTVYPVGKKHT